MANIRIPTYERQVEAPQQRASQAKAPEPLRQAYGENVAQATGNLGKAMMQLGQDFLRIQANTDKNNLIITENNIRMSYKQIKPELMKSQSLEEYQQKVDDYLKNIQEQAKAQLGDRAYSVYENTYLKPLYQGIALDLELNKVDMASKINTQKIGEVVDQELLNISNADSIDDINLSRAVATSTVDTAPMNIVEKEKALKDINKRLDVGQAYRMAVLDPENIINDLKDNTKYTNLTDADKRSLIPKLEKIINYNEQTKLYDEAILQSKADGTTDFQKAIDYVKKSEGTPLNKRKVINMLNAELVKERSVAQKEYDAKKNEALNTLYEAQQNGGDIKQAIQDIQDSPYLLASDKANIVKKFTSGTKNMDNPYTKMELMNGIVTGNITDENDILTKYLSGEISNTTKTTLTKMLKNVQGPNQDILKIAMRQLNKSYNNGIVGMTPAEARGLASSQQQVLLIYTEAVGSGKSTREIQELLSPERVQKIAETNRPTLEENTMEIEKQIRKKDSGDVLNLDIEAEDNGGDILGLGI